MAILFLEKKASQERRKPPTGVSKALMVKRVVDLPEKKKSREGHLRVKKKGSSMGAKNPPHDEAAEGRRKEASPYKGRGQQSNHSPDRRKRKGKVSYFSYSTSGNQRLKELLPSRPALF